MAPASYVRTEATLLNTDIGVLQAVGKTVEYYEYPQAARTFYGVAFDLMMERSLTCFDTYVK